MAEKQAAFNTTTPTAAMNTTICSGGAPSCTFSISPASQSFSSAGGTGSFGVTASAPSCAWTASTSDSWIHITSGSGTGSGTVSFNVDANSSASPRTGTIAVQGQTFTVQQAGGGIGQVTITEYSAGITAGAWPRGITAGPDGALWFTEYQANQIGRITTTGMVSEYHAGITAGALPIAITAGPDGALWFADWSQFSYGRIGRITTTGLAMEYSAGVAAKALPRGITAGPDGALWFTEWNSDRIGRITTAGLVTEYSITAGAKPAGITVGPDGALWFTECFGNRIGRITTAGVLTEYSLGITPLPPGGYGPGEVTAGPDGALWFTEGTNNRIGRITTGGVVTEYSSGITPGAWPNGITAGPDGALWFTESGGNRIGRITTAGVVTEYSAGITAGAAPWDITSGPDGALWFTEQDGNRIGRISGIPQGLTHSRWLSAVAHVDVPATGAYWRSDVAVLNRTATTAQLELRAYTTGGMLTMSSSAGPNAQVLFKDVAAQLGLTNGSAAFEVRSSQDIFLSGRTYNQVAFDTTYGQDYDGMDATTLLSAGQSGYLTQLTQNGYYRTNIGVTNAGTGPASVTVTIYDGTTGAQLWTDTRSYDPGGFYQYNQPLKTIGSDNAYAKITVNSGSGVFSCASVIDQKTNDATTITMKTGGGGSAPGASFEWWAMPGFLHEFTQRATDTPADAAALSTCAPVLGASVTTDSAVLKAVDPWTTPGGKPIILAGGRGGLALVNAATNTLLATIPYTSWQSVGDTKGRVFLASETSGVKAFQVGEGTNFPQLIGGGTTAGSVFGLAWLVPDQMLVAASDSAGLEVFRVEAGGSLTSVGRASTRAPSWAVAVKDGLVASASTNFGLELFSPGSQPGSLLQRGSLALPGQAFDVELYGGYAYVSSFAGGLHVVDVTNPDLPVLRQTLHRSTYVFDSACGGNYLAVASANQTSGASGEVALFDISSPASPVLLWATQADFATAVAFVNQKLALGREVAGVGIFDMPSCWSQSSKSRWLSAVAHVDVPATGAYWRSDVAALNRTASTATLELRAYTASGVLTMASSVGPNAQVLFKDVAAQLGLTNGSAAFEVRSSADIFLSGRTYNQVAFDTTYGQDYDGVDASTQLSAGQSAYLTQLTQNAYYRSNIGVTNAGTGVASVTVTIYDGASGAQLWSDTRTYNPGDFYQYNQPLKTIGSDNAYAKVTANSGSGVFSCASVIDQKTNDATTIAMKR